MNKLNTHPLTSLVAGKKTLPTVHFNKSNFEAYLTNSLFYKEGVS